MSETPKLFTVGQVTTATFLGSPIAGAVLLALNYRTLGEPTKARQAVVWGVVATAALMVLSWFLPESFPNMILPVAYTIGIAQLTKQLQGPAIERHLAEGGARGSHWKSVGVGLAGLLAVVVVMVALIFVIPEDKVVFGDSEVYWERGATEEQARMVGAYMGEIGAFGPGSAMSIYVAQPGEALELSFLIADRGWTDPAIVAAFQDLADSASADMLGGAPVEVHLCDDFLRARETLTSSPGF